MLQSVDQLTQISVYVPLLISKHLWVLAYGPILRNAMRCHSAKGQNPKKSKFGLVLCTFILVTLDTMNSACRSFRQRDYDLHACRSFFTTAAYSEISRRLRFKDGAASGIRQRNGCSWPGRITYANILLIGHHEARSRTFGSPISTLFVRAHSSATVKGKTSLTSLIPTTILTS